MRIITDHQVNPANDKLVIQVLDEPGAGGANHRYQITGFDPRGNPSAPELKDIPGDYEGLLVLFQNGPIADAGVNGVTQEVLLAVVIDRLRSFQSGPYACEENANALRAIEEGQQHLLNRTRARMARGVEGTHQK